MANISQAPWSAAPPRWMTAKPTRELIAALTADGADVRFVGGCVRDALLGRASNDIDIGTPDPPERVMALLANAGIVTRTVPRGIAHGTVTALASSDRYEITTLRRDERTDGRHAEVAFTDDWEKDAARRDFTINAMSATPDGALHDYFGGQADLAAGRVRFVGDPATRIAEDHLRLLRFFRFHAWYGKGEPDPEALDACRAAVHKLRKLSGERVQAEMKKMLEAHELSPEAVEMMQLLAASAPLQVVREMRNTGVLYELLPEAPETKRFARLVGIEKKVSEADSIRRLACLIASSDDAISDAKAVAERWRLSGADGARLAALVKFGEALRPDLDLRAQDRLLYRHGPALFCDLVLLAWATEWHGESEKAWRKMLKRAEEWEAPTFPVTGADVLERSIPEGPEVGRLLRAVEDWWIEQDLTPGRALTLERLDALIADRRED